MKIVKFEITDQTKYKNYRRRVSYIAKMKSIGIRSYKNSSKKLIKYNRPIGRSVIQKILHNNVKKKLKSLQAKNINLQGSEEENQ